MFTKGKPLTSLLRRVFVIGPIALLVSNVTEYHHGPNIVYSYLFYRTVDCATPSNCNLEVTIPALLTEDAFWILTAAVWLVIFGAVRYARAKATRPPIPRG